MKKSIYAISFVFIFILNSIGGVFAKDKDYIIIDVDKISSYKEERVVYQRIERPEEQQKDNSVEVLMVIKDRKIYYVVDGYDNPADVNVKRVVMNIENKYIENNDYWTNKINGRPDFIRILYRRNELLRNTSEDFVSSNFGEFYKSVRDKFIKLHVEKFRNLLKNRSESGLSVKRNLIALRTSPDNPNNVTQIFFKSASAKAGDETVYYCEDADGDGITETFMVYRKDGFNWGVDCGPNIIMIYGNTDKDIETLIGKLVNEAENGTVEEEKKMFQEFPKEKDIHEMMEQMTPLDKFYE